MPQPSVEQLLQAALVHHQAGRLPQAQALYQQILQTTPQCADAWHLFGVLAHQTAGGGGGNEMTAQAASQNAQAEEMIRRAINLNPRVAAYYGNLGVVLDALNRLTEAAAVWQHALNLAPNYVEALNNLGRAMDRLGQPKQAEELWLKAMTIRPDFPDIYNNLGVARAKQNRKPEAAGFFEQALKLNPNYIDALLNLASLHRDENRFDHALALFDRALAQNPNVSRAHTGRGDALRLGKRYPEAQAAYEKSFALDPASPDTMHSLALLDRERERLAEAETWYRRAVAARPGQAEWLSNLASCLQEQARMEEALEYFRQALALDPSHPGLHFNISLVYLLLGRLAEGWPEYHFRLKCPQFVWLHRQFPQATWEGQPLQGKRILLYSEQGHGDAFHFVRYAKLVADRGAHVILESQPAVQSLLATAPGIAETVERAPIGGLPPFEFQASLLNLPQVLQTTLDTIPADVPYLHVHPDILSLWHERVLQAAPQDGKLKVGLVWAGNPGNSSEWKRSMRLAQFAPLAQVPNVRFFSLQKGDPAAQAANPPPGMELLDLTPDIRDFMDTAALMSQLDLIIGVDTSVIHVAGALALPVWTLLPASPDWRWLLHRPDTPWYPTMRLYRQLSLKNWSPVLERLTQDLHHHAAHHKK